MRTFVSSTLTETPSERRQLKVDAQSRLLEKLDSRDGPSAQAAISAARCEIDLSPGSVAFPLSLRAELIFIRANVNAVNVRTATISSRSEKDLAAD